MPYGKMVNFNFFIILHTKLNQNGSQKTFYFKKVITRNNFFRKDPIFAPWKEQRFL